jgi:hypothetical protein
VVRVITPTPTPITTVAPAVTQPPAFIGQCVALWNEDVNAGPRATVAEEYAGPDSTYGHVGPVSARFLDRCRVTVTTQPKGTVDRFDQGTAGEPFEGLCPLTCTDPLTDEEADWNVTVEADGYLSPMSS